jgi:hypothetical protein
MSKPLVDGPLNRGAFISRFILSQDGTVLSGERAYDTVFDETAGTSFPAADSTNSSPDFTRFCSASLAGPESGFDRPLYFAGEEAGAPDTFDGRGGTLTAFGFIRIEDGAWSKTSRKDFYFVTTGGGTGNLLGRLYHLELNPGNPLQAATLSVVYNADQIIDAGGDVAISPDNIDTSADYIVICEDGTATSQPVMADKGRDGSIWRFDLHNNFAYERVAELNPPGRDGVPVGPGIWETSGIIDTTSLFGNGSWLVDTQAHSPTTPPGPGTVEDGQLLIMVPAN